MPTYLYCILQAGGEPPPDLRAGVGGSPVRMLSAGPLAAWVETVAQRSIAPSIEGARTHDAIISAALDRGDTPLPARFGQIFESDEACRDALVERMARIEGDLARVRGCVEMRVIVRLPRPDAGTISDEPEPGASPGTAYMQKLQRGRTLEQIVQASASAVRRRLTETVGAFVRDEAVTLVPLPAATLTISHLVPRDEIAAYRSALDDVAPGVRVDRLIISGPVAPYQFVSASHD